MTKSKKPQMSKIETTVMDKIQSGQVKMHARTYYILVTVLSVAAVAVLAVALSYLVSLAGLWLRIQTTSGRAWGAQRNLTTLVDNFPWWAVVLAVVALAGLVLIVKKLGSLYKIRLAYLVSAIVLVALLIGYGLSYTNLPNTFKRHNQTLCQHGDDACLTRVQGRRFRQQ